LSINQSVKPAYNKDKEDILCTLANACAFGNNPAIAQSYYTQTVDVLKTIVKRDFAFLTEQERNGYWNTLQTDLQHFSAFGYKMNTFDCPFTTELYNAVLFSKGLLINSDNEVSRLVSKNPVLTVMQHELNSLQQEIESKQQKGLNTDSLRLKRQKKEAEMLEKCTGLYGNYTQFLSIDFKDVVARLGEKDVALEFHDFKCGKDSTMYCAFILKPGMSNPKMVPLFEKKTLDSLQLAPSLTFASAFSYGSKEDHDTIYQSKELGQLIWGKILPFLNDGQHVYFSPTGIFYQLGIENLPLEDNQPFSDHYTVYRLSSTRELATATTVSSDGKAVLYGGLQYDEDAPTMADMSHRNRRKQDFSDYSTLAYEGNRSLSDLTKHRDGGKTGPVPSTRDDGEVTSLPYTKEEVTEINAQLTSPASKNALRTTMYTGTGGNEESFKALSGTHPRILHIATHGFFLPQYEAEAFYDQRSFLMGINEQQKADAEVSLSRSGLLLAGASKAWNGEVIPDSIDDGILTAKEIAHMDLKGTDLVVLSACETGLGDVTGDGVFGLQRGFKKAGVNTLVMSLWKVDDKATKIFMTQFYANLMNGQSKRTAFLNAQKFLRDYHSPAGQSNGTAVNPYASPEYWAAFILLDGIH
ncbi:MAG: CHAT domain-containing protein, partial [Bacteroidota bacterium]|nr:CHAT domain-containing protein [Bacteroidota bacterium]